jgi:hypothetical protein
MSANAGKERAMAQATAVDFNKLLQDIIGAAKTTAAQQFPKIESAVTTGAQQLLVLAEDIDQKKRLNQINDDEASMLLELQHNSQRAMLMAVEGISALAAEAVANAVIKVVADTLNVALGSAIKLL